MPNGKEITDGTDPNDPCSFKTGSQTATPSAAWLAADCDGDGVPNSKEITDGTDPNNTCSFKTASQTVATSAAWKLLDCDGDGLPNGKEITDGTDPQNGCSLKAPRISADGDLKMCTDEQRKLVVQREFGFTVQWFKNGAAIAGATKDTLLVSVAGSYTAVFTNATGCVSAASKPVLIEIVCITIATVPDVFTPNGDGDNDVISPVVPGIKRLRCFEVYNRWGNLIFTTNEIGKGWDGKFRGKDQPAESYLWLIEGVDSRGNRVKKTGMFTLIR